ncbi:conserved hypothetical protein [Xenorhabdus nematophila F1]|uniref:Uncharacterized protein n=1 Tax=Xenorhabdus nematophila (strain ATCC 19061 / DSM 3370 / CCUG 14189 / LMG 1036 / NCIMB 9965 / AN6) TaxID=406817 RepID=D3VC38_XENNA|nr:hypothetical protein XNC1_1628 [Xenorhabdus nematophila ATCC 19061]CCW29941.1 conserved hypothetical protein [Xenorhabdus nematophila F1]CEE94238.1 hypothetical protein XNA1_4530020 [Xenorhabdus nematophila str. Anatoliense]CEF32646.1 hypothetical protein XNW1_4440003 [Xenorhabdus nematophila str. Websteri]CEK22577.1 hypothetical protein XNC2_1583 [Xenorhabdus nematophila AN6/1]
MIGDSYSKNNINTYSKYLQKICFKDSDNDMFPVCGDPLYYTE